MSGHMDDRGSIVDLIFDGPVDCVTEIFTRQGAVRGNHYHKDTTQWTYVVSGCIRVVTPNSSAYWNGGEMFCDLPGEPHAWKAIEDTVCLVFTRGPRSGENYESDTFRLEEPLLT